MVETMVETITELVERDEFECYGIRVIAGESPAVGATLPASYIWVDGDSTGEELDGTCAVGIRPATGWSVDRAIAETRCYFGASVALIAGNRWSYGEDAGEVIIRDAVVLAAWTK